jgi:hypothetical protein
MCCVFRIGRNQRACVGAVGSAAGAGHGKWKVRILCLLLDYTKRSSELERMLPGVHRGTPTHELRRIEADRIVRRTHYSLSYSCCDGRRSARSTSDQRRAPDELCRHFIGYSENASHHVFGFAGVAQYLKNGALDDGDDQIAHPLRRRVRPPTERSRLRLPVTEAQRKVGCRAL